MEESRETEPRCFMEIEKSESQLKKTSTESFSREKYLVVDCCLFSLSFALRVSQSLQYFFTWASHLQMIGMNGTSAVLNTQTA